VGHSWLSRRLPLVGNAAAAIVGVAVPLVLAWLLAPLPRQGHVVAAATLPIGIAAVWKLSPRVTTVRFALGAIGLAALLAWGTP
jgi:hypothetical protein